MASASLCPGTPQGQHAPPAAACAATHTSRKIGTLPIMEDGREICADELLYRLSDVAESALLLERHLREDRQGAALAAILHRETTHLAGVLDRLLATEVAHG